MYCVIRIREKTVEDMTESDISDQAFVDLSTSDDTHLDIFVNQSESKVNEFVMNND